MAPKLVYLTYSDALKEIATSTMACLQKHIGTTAYVQVYQQVQEHINAVRRDRRSAKAVQAVSDPQASAVRRQQKNDMKRNSRKRKIEKYSVQKGKRSKE